MAGVPARAVSSQPQTTCPGRWPGLSQWPPAPCAPVKLWLVTGRAESGGEGPQLAKAGDVASGFQRQRGAGDLRRPARLNVDNPHR
jgi:hypothetical protein